MKALERLRLCGGMPDAYSWATVAIGILRRVLCDQPHPTEGLAYCELPRGHKGGHSATIEKAVDW